VRQHRKRAEPVPARQAMDRATVPDDAVLDAGERGRVPVLAVNVGTGVIRAFELNPRVVRALAAEMCALAKGREILVEGHLTVETWETQGGK